MFKVVPFKPEHVLSLVDQPINKDLKEFFYDGMASHLEGTNAVTLLREDQIMVCGGLTSYWPGRGQVWTVFSESSKPHFVATFRAVDRWLKTQMKYFHRIEVTVPCDFDLGHRRAELLGFKLELLRARKYLPGGIDCSIYVRLRE